MVDFQYFIPLFHDGEVTSINHQDARCVVGMASSELTPEDNRYKTKLDQYNRLNGELIIEGISSISLNSKPFSGKLEMFFEDGELNLLVRINFDLCEIRREVKK